MIKIRAGFIQDKHGGWHNLKNASSLFVSGAEDVGFYISLLMQGHGMPRIISEDHKTVESAQEQLDGILELLEYEVWRLRTAP